MTREIAVDASSDIVIKIALITICIEQLVAQVENVGCEEANTQQCKNTNNGILISSQ